MRVSRWVWVAGGVPLAVGYPVLPAPWRAAVYLAVGAVAVAGLLAGAVRRPAAGRPPWLCIAAAICSAVAGDLVYRWPGMHHPAAGLPSVADVGYLLSYPLLAAGLLGLARRRRPDRDLPGLVDSLILAAGLGVLGWALFGHLALTEGSVPGLTRAQHIAFPLADVLLAAALSRFVTCGAARPRAAGLMVAAVVAILAADGATAVLGAVDGRPGPAPDLLWFAGYLLLAAAALDPSGDALAEPGAGRVAPASRLRLAALAAATLVAPGVLAVQLLTGTRSDGWAAVIGSTVLFGLVVVRLDLVIVETAAAHRRQEALTADVARLSAHDALTGLPNRAELLTLLVSALHRAVRSGSTTGLLAVDLDGLQQVNDSYGQPVGDEVLRQVAGRIGAVVRVGDAAGRFGGDEFLVVVEPVSDDRALLDLGQRLLAALAAPFPVAGRLLSVRFSIGVATSSDGDVDPGRLLREVDLAVRRAKAAGGGTVELFDGTLRRELAERAEIAGAITAGLAAGEFLVHYQPVVTVATGRVEGYEALVRWRRPGGGLVPPDSFIPVAEGSSLICDLDRWVLHEATRQLAAWVPDGERSDGAPTVAVNISGRHLASPEIVADVASALAFSGLPASRLVLEVTETVLVGDPVATEHLRALRGLGVAISIDDFGTGYTSIGQLQRLPADILKIDKEFVGTLGPAACALVALMVNAAHAFGLSVVAEGVEEPHQLAVLRKLRCDSAQGYLFARPMPAEEVPVPAPRAAADDAPHRVRPTG